MSSNRFYLPSISLEQGSEVKLPEAVSRQVARVLRKRSGDEIVLFDGSGAEWRSRIVSIDGDAVRAAVGASFAPDSEPQLDMTVCQALVPAERMEFVVQKSTELGASRIIPLVTERVQARDRNVSRNKIDRWHRIAVEATEQSGRTRVPEILPDQDLADCVSEAASRGPVIMLWEEKQGTSLVQAVRQSLASRPRGVTVLIGPVGGFSEAEAEMCKSAGALLAWAGPRILRAETAPIVALTALMYEAGELGPGPSTGSQ